MLLDLDENSASFYLVRLFGGRGIFLGVAARVVPERDRNKILDYAAPIDLADATAAAVAGRRRPWLVGGGRFRRGPPCPPPFLVS
ncbi:hypothetical protein [Arthrobacter humicola]|uniref:hypothetical protein n=1 Tax=Arthrobacter humicola TaxID=409291 RepID=UPI001FAB4008|nr:hypothetical protein [Arthrobacter humicola]MCI9870567.1 hypothetical protein [Arthrobacter humicola]